MPMGTIKQEQNQGWTPGFVLALLCYASTQRKLLSRTCSLEPSESRTGGARKTLKLSLDRAGDVVYVQDMGNEISLQIAWK